MAKTFHYHIGKGALPGYSMFSFFSFTDGRLHVGQCQSVKNDELAIEVTALKRNGWSEASWKFDNGKPILVSS